MTRFNPFTSAWMFGLWLLVMSVLATIAWPFVLIWAALGGWRVLHHARIRHAHVAAQRSMRHFADLAAHRGNVTPEAVASLPPIVRAPRTRSPQVDVRPWQRQAPLQVTVHGVTPEYAEVMAAVYFEQQAR